MCFIIEATEATEIGSEAKKSLRVSFNSKLAKHNRKLPKPPECIPVLPTLEELKTQYPRVYEEVFPLSPPVKCQLTTNKWLFDAEAMPTRGNGVVLKSKPVIAKMSLEDSDESSSMRQFGMFMMKGMQVMQANQQQMFDVMINGSKNSKLDSLQNAGGGVGPTGMRRCITYNGDEGMDIGDIGCMKNIRLF